VQGSFPIPRKDLFVMRQSAAGISQTLGRELFCNAFELKSGHSIYVKVEGPIERNDVLAHS
jgi:hypothetical protein